MTAPQALLEFFQKEAALRLFASSLHRYLSLQSG
jgi:hypothetical protein